MSRTALQISAISWATSLCMPGGGQVMREGSVGVTILLGMLYVSSCCSSGEHNLCIGTLDSSLPDVKLLISSNSCVLFHRAASAMREQFESSQVVRSTDPSELAG